MKLLRIARRDARGALRSLSIFLACMALGTGAIAAVGLLARATSDGIAAQAGELLGGDLSIRTIYQPVSGDARRYIDSRTRASQSVTLRTMAVPDRPGASFADRQLVELKAVDASYPLLGKLEFEPALPRQRIFGRSGDFGVAVEPDLLASLHLKLGDRLKIGEKSYPIRATIAHEPDRLNASYALGPRILIADAALAETGLTGYGSLLYYRLALLLPEGTTSAAFRQDVARFDDGGWEVSDLTAAAPGLQRALDRVAVFLSFAAVATLLIGGIGIAGASEGYFRARLLTIARLKALGMTQAQIVTVYALQLAATALIGSTIGLAFGIGGEHLLLTLFGDKLPIAAKAGLYVEPLVLALAFGVTAAAAFGLPPLFAAARTRSAVLLRDGTTQILPPRRAIDLAILLLGILGLLALTIVFTGRVRLALWFGGSMLGALALFLVLAEAIRLVSRRCSKPGGRLPPEWRLAVAGLARSGAITRSVVVAMGLGATVMIAVALIAYNFHAQLTFDRSPDIPSFFLIDIPPFDAPRLDAALKTLPGVREVRIQPMLRGRLVAVNGVRPDRDKIDPEFRWMIANDRGISYAGDLPPGSRVVEGAWWPKDYAGEPLVSLAADAAKGVGIQLGDHVTFSALGHEVTARVSALREVDWSSLQMNFSILLTPNAFGDLPVNELATIRADDASHGAILHTLARDFPAVSVVRLKETLRQVAALFDTISTVVLSVGVLTVIVGLLVIIGSLSSTLETRAYEAVLLRVIGQTRREMQRRLWIEMLGLALLSIGFSLVAGSIVAAVIGSQMRLPRLLLSPAVIGLASACALPVAGLLVAVASRRLLAARPLTMLRHE